VIIILLTVERYSYKLCNENVITNLMGRYLAKMQNMLLLRLGFSFL